MVSSVISILQLSAGAVLFAPGPANPLLNPPGKGKHGSCNDDCVTPCFLDRFRT